MSSSLILLLEKASNMFPFLLPLNHAKPFASALDFFSSFLRLPHLAHLSRRTHTCNLMQLGHHGTEKVVLISSETHSDYCCALHGIFHSSPRHLRRHSQVLLIAQEKSNNDVPTGSTIPRLHHEGLSKTLATVTQNATASGESRHKPHQVTNATNRHSGRQSTSEGLSGDLGQDGCGSSTSSRTAHCDPLTTEFFSLRRWRRMC